MPLALFERVQLFERKKENKQSTYLPKQLKVVMMMSAAARAISFSRHLGP